MGDVNENKFAQESKNERLLTFYTMRMVHFTNGFYDKQCKDYFGV